MMGQWFQWVDWAGKSYIPHGHCYLWQKPLVALHLTSDLLIAIAYFSIPTMLIYFVRKRQDTPFTTVFLMFGAFISACGLGHLLDIWTLWFPHYWLSGVERAFTAFISCLTALKLVEWMPQFLGLRSPKELEVLNQQLQSEIEGRQRAQQVLQNLLEGTASATGEAFFPALVEHLAQSLNVRHAFVSESFGEPVTIRSIAVWSDGAIADGFEASIQNSPCVTVVETCQAQYFPHQVQSLFPEVDLLTAAEATSYLGVPILDSQGQALGLLCIAHDRPLPHPDEAQAVMTIFAAKAGAEIQRQRAESALRKAYAEMEQRVADRTSELRTANHQLLQVAQRERATTRVIQRMRQSLDLETIFRATTEELRQAIQCDRVITYRFNPDWSGNIIAEAVKGGWKSLLTPEHGQAPWEANALSEDYCTVRILSIDTSNLIQDSYLQDTRGSYCQDVDYITVEDIYTRDFSACYLELLESMDARAYIIVPIYSGRRLWGLLACYQNDSPRDWQDGESQMLVRVGAQLGVAIQHAELFQRVQQQTLELREAKDAADRANQAKSEFLASMSHELRTPLNAILGFTQIMHRDSALPARHQRYVEIVNTSGEHLLGLINNVLDMSKIEAGQLTLQPEPFELAQLLQELQDLMGLKAQKKGLTFTVTQGPNVPTGICADQGKLRQVLLNLVGNSLKFTERGGISITVARADEDHAEDLEDTAAIALQFTVEDTGAGMAPEELQALFQPFQQTQSGLKSGQGTGLGVPLSQQYIRMMGGDLTVDSQVGHGTRFTFTIQAEHTPRFTRSSAQPAALGTVVGLAEDQPPCRILVAEDNPVNQLLLQNLLEPIGLEIRQVDNGEDAIAQWESWHPHLIWMDMRMPRLDGYETTRRIRDAERDRNLAPTVIIALTATAFAESKAAILSAGCNDMVCKPFKTSELFDKMALYLDLHYRYETNASDVEPVLPGGQISIERLSEMPLTWLQAMQQAAAQCSDIEMLSLLDRVPPAQAALAEGLRELTNVYQFEKILDLLESAIAAAPPQSAANVPTGANHE